MIHLTLFIWLLQDGVKSTTHGMNPTLEGAEQVTSAHKRHKAEQRHVPSRLCVELVSIFPNNSFCGRKYMILHTLTVLFIRTMLGRDVFVEVLWLLASHD